ncbi:glycine betaine/L-proline ABC transporter ATP-binding protein [Serpentinicella sp. ANB-PHB4]|uniref:quaternary amine ABC transporter ATP-binding protein n=1 Tax=Serpentinicella sp. ANB-PHB4 TaxID=3074076 RepID=UPI0028667D32|nr:glycine betaine/L-proline ABC transporter ATP-binding protein [Serpentinicella sp. ANB-PHB4]MDR5659041.1 glycine betaine/L-proline ABC transporter ATP-binding protein [Serpentinicella sp. ANB-PHB4]
MPKLKVENLVKIFGDHPQKALKLLDEGYSKNEIHEKTKQTVGINKANFEVNEGEIFVIMGLSGSGKSTLIRCINRLIKSTSGSIYLDGEDITKMDKESLREVRRKKLGMVFQRFALFPHKTVLENVAYGLEIQGLDKSEQEKKSREALELVGLKGWADSKTNQLSGGMQQRVGLARALAIEPDILLMDEAFSALDPLIKKEMQDELLDLHSSMNKTIIFITHDLNEALKLGDRVALMKDGEIVQIDTPEGILTNPANDYVAKFVENVDRSRVLTASDVMIKPSAVASLKDGPRVALRKMKEESISSIFVVDRNKVLQGVVTAEDAVESVEAKETSLTPILKPHDLQVAPDTSINEILAIIADAKVPVAVVENGKLQGVIIRGAVLAGLAGGELANVES